MDSRLKSMPDASPTLRAGQTCRNNLGLRDSRARIKQ